MKIEKDGDRVAIRLGAEDVARIAGGDEAWRTRLVDANTALQACREARVLWRERAEAAERDRDETRRSLAAMTHAARRAAGVSLRDAATLIGVSAVDLGKHERGKAMLSHEQLTPLMDIANARGATGRAGERRCIVTTDTKLKLWHWYADPMHDPVLLVGYRDNNAMFWDPTRESQGVQTWGISRAKSQVIGPIAGPGEPPSVPKDRKGAERMAREWAEAEAVAERERDEWKERVLAVERDAAHRRNTLDRDDPSGPPEGHVRVRIAVAVDAGGEWVASGQDDWTEEARIMSATFDYTRAGLVTMVEADVPLPREPETVRGRESEGAS